MKTLILKVFAIGLFGLIPIVGCIETVKDPCKETQWEKADDPVIFLKASIAVPNFEYNKVIYNINKASSVTFTGTITKYYCSGEKSGSFDFNAIYYPANGSLSFSLLNLKIGGPFQFMFQNDLDYLHVEGRLMLEFPDGSKFKPVIGSTFQSYYFKDIKLDVNEMAYYILLDFNVINYEKVNI